MQNWLTHNPIADLYGPHFLFFYGLVILGTLLWSAALRSLSDPTADLPPPPIPPEPDPYEIAFLRGGTEELARTVIFRLLRDGYLTTETEGREKAQKRRLIRLPDHATELADLTPLEREVRSWFQRGLTPDQVFLSDFLRRIDPYLAPYQSQLEQEQLLKVPAQSARLVRLWCGGMLAITSLGGYKLLIALSRGKQNVGFLILFWIVGTILLTLLCNHTGRLSARGQAYLDRLQLAFAGLRSSRRPTEEGAVPAAPLLLMSLFGAHALGNTPYGYFPAMFQQAGSCGGSSGSSCGASCGGGGGCGGGGCGGCGGG